MHNNRLLLHWCCLTSSLLVVGHGRSGGERVYIEDFSVYVRDIINHVQDLKAAYTGLPFFLMGHSMVWFVVHCFVNSFIFPFIVSFPHPIYARGWLCICH